MILTIVFAGLALVVGAAASFAISRRISRPVTAMTRAMQRLAEKDLDVEVPATGQRDEIGAMAQAVLVFKENMRSEEHTSELQSLMRISYAVFCLKKKKPTATPN